MPPNQRQLDDNYESAPQEAALQETGPTLYSPEGVLVLFTAVMLDILGGLLFVLSLIGIGIPLSFILDGIGMATIGLWTFLRFRQMPMKKTVKRIFMKFGLAAFVEMIPFLGNISPSWTILVFNLLKR